MILRRIREHVAHHNWFAVAIDLLIVVDRRLPRHPGQQLESGAPRTAARRANIAPCCVDDLEHEPVQIWPMRRHYYQWVRSEALGHRSAALRRPVGELGEQFLLDAYQASQIQPWALKRNTYDQILCRRCDGQSRQRRCFATRSPIITSAPTSPGPTSPPFRHTGRFCGGSCLMRSSSSIRAVCNEQIVEDERGAVRHDRCPAACGTRPRSGDRAEGRGLRFTTGQALRSISIACSSTSTRSCSQSTPSPPRAQSSRRSWNAADG